IRGEFRNGSASYVVPKIAPDFKSFLTVGHVDGNVKFWDIGTRKLKTYIEPKLMVGSPVGYSPDGKMVVTQGILNATPVQMWDIKAGKVKRTFKADKMLPVTAATFTPDSQSIAVAAKNHVILHDCATGEERGKWTMPDNFLVGGILISADG